MNMQSRLSTMLVMDSSGHTTVTWDPRDPASVRDAKAKFDEFIEAGHQCFEMDVADENGVVVEEKGRRITEFNPRAGKLMMVPQLRGG